MSLALTHAGTVFGLGCLNAHFVSWRSICAGKAFKLVGSVLLVLPSYQVSSDNWLMCASLVFVFLPLFVFYHIRVVVDGD